MSLEEDMLIERFLKNELSPTEEAAFVRKMKMDKSWRERVLLDKQLFETLNEKDWSFISNVDSKEIKEYEALFKSGEAMSIAKSINQGSKAYFSKRKRWRIAYTVAASLTILLLVISLSDSEPSPEELYASYVEKTELPSFIDRGDTDLFSQGQISFEGKDYKTTKDVFSGAIDSLQSQHAGTYIYLALAQMELEEYSAAENTLEQLINSDLLDAEKGYWFRSLLYLKSGQDNKLKDELTTIISHSYFKNEAAKALLEQLQ